MRSATVEKRAREANARLRCPACNKASWCLVEPEGSCRCYRVASRFEHTDKLGGVYWWHPAPAGAAPIPDRWAPRLEQPRASAAVLHSAYEQLLRQLSLEAKHLAHLTEERGLPASLVEDHGFRSVPSVNVADLVARQIAPAFAEHWNTVPGFYMRGDRPRLAFHGEGIVIPCRRPSGHIAGLQIRLDNPPDGKGRYRSFSSQKQGGACSGTLPSFWFPPAEGCPAVRLAEGAFKAAVLARALGRPAIGAPGCGQLSSPLVLDWLARLRPQTVVLSLDPDVFASPKVGEPVRNCVHRLNRQPGFTLLLEVFPPVNDVLLKPDDAALAGAHPRRFTPEQLLPLLANHHRVRPAPEVLAFLKAGAL